MKFYNLSDIDGFFKAIDSCKGRVELVTSDGDRLNLKSRLCQFVSFANIIATNPIEEIEIVASEPEDVHRLMQFMMNHK